MTNEALSVHPVVVYEDNDEIVPAHMTTWGRCGHPSNPAPEGELGETDPMCMYIDGRSVVERLPDATGLADGTTCELSYAGGSGWYMAYYHVESGAWVNDGDNAPWQLSA
jgi:hypothetical protein